MILGEEIYKVMNEGVKKVFLADHSYSAPGSGPDF